MISLGIMPISQVWNIISKRPERPVSPQILEHQWMICRQRFSSVNMWVLMIVFGVNMWCEDSVMCRYVGVDDSVWCKYVV